MLIARRLHGASLVLDTLIAVAFGAGATAAGGHFADDFTAGLVVCTWLVALPLAFRRRWPLAVLIAVTAAETLYAVLDYPGGPVYLGVIIAVYTVATRWSRPRALAAAGASTAVLYAGTVIGSGIEELWTPIHILFATWAVAAVFIGDATRNRGRYVESLRERARQAEETREEEALRRVAEERVRIARDLHDVVAHSLATITVQAAAGARVFEKEPEEARGALLAIRETSKQALQELGATLDLLRPAREAAPLAPSPGLEHIGLEASLRHSRA